MEIEMPINMGHGYRLYITVVDMPPAEFERQKSKLFPIIHSDIDDTFRYARNALNKGLFVHLIEGDDGKQLTIGQIRKILKDREHELKGQPKVY